VDADVTRLAVWRSSPRGRITTSSAARGGWAAAACVYLASAAGDEISRPPGDWRRNDTATCNAGDHKETNRANNKPTIHSQSTFGSVITQPASIKMTRDHEKQRLMRRSLSCQMQKAVGA